MTERDAFGNPIEESRPTGRPLTDGDPLRAPAAEPAPTIGIEEDASPNASEPSSTPIQARRQRRALGCLLGLLLLPTPFLVGGWFVYQAFDDAVSPAVDIINDVRDTVREQTRTITEATVDTETPASPPRGLRRGSLLRPAAFDALLRKARANPGGKLLLLRLAPERADLQLSRPSGGLSLVQLRYDGGRTLVRSSAGGSGRKSITFSKIDTSAPSRLVRAAAHRLGRKTTSIDYLVLINVLDGPTWAAYFKGGAAFQGDAHGKIVRRIQ